MGSMERYNAFLRQRDRAATRRAPVALRRLGQGKIVPASGPADAVLIDFSSNDYLALTEHPALIAASGKLLAEMGTGAGAARLMSGTLEIHQQLEQETALLKGTEAALVFGSGYLANIGVIPALVDRRDVIFCDRLNHASIYDGCLLAGARLIRFRHNDLNHLEQLLRQQRSKFQQALIIVESIYSMDGDRCPLKELAGLKNRFNCLLLVDEAHATGLYGAGGGGLIEEDAVSASVDIAMGTFSKALGSYGAYIAASRPLVDYLVNRARTFIYSTALPPAVVGASLAALRLVRNEPGLRRDLHQRVELFKKCLSDGGLTDDPGPSQIVPILVGESRRAVAIAAALREKGYFVTAVRPPTVPKKTARLRFSITRHHRPEELRQAAAALLRALAEVR